MQISVLGIVGSARRGGNSEFLLEQALEAAPQALPDYVETDFYRLANKEIAGCNSCYGCDRLGGECTIEDDFQDLRERWYRADVILYSVPVYHLGVPGQLKCFFDRLGNSAYARFDIGSMPKLLKVIGGIAQGMAFAAGQENVLTQIIYHAFMMGSIPVAGDEPECYLGAAGWTQYDDQRKALRRLSAEQEEAATASIKGARSLARRAVELALIIKSGTVASEEHLADDPTYGPLRMRVQVAGD